MLILTREEMREADRRMIEDVGVPGIVLMEHAALKLKEHCKEDALILCGSGNNGGDGLALARLLFLEKKNPTVILIHRSPLKGDALINYNACVHLGMNIISCYDDLTPLEEELRTSSMVVDCLFGTGLSREIGSPYREAIGMVNASSLFILSADLPSGMDANTGETLGISIRADKTISFHAMKKGLQQLDHVEVVDIGIEGYEK